METEKLKAQLKEWLSTKAQLEEVRTFPWSKDRPHPPCFVMEVLGAPERSNIRADDHHTMRADAFILDETLGSIGVVHCLGSDANQILTNPSATKTASDPNPAQPSAPQATQKKEPSLLEGFISQWIEEAVYLRHLMGMKVDASHLDVKPSTGRVVPSVELVFVLSEKDEVALKQVRDRLIFMKQNTSLLHAIGINLVVVPEKEDPKLDPFDRGFAWLLRHTRTWWGSRNKEGSTSSLPQVGHKKWSGLTMTNFRVRGERQWSVGRPGDPSFPALHVLHGPNGSGKSSLAEAFEFAVTGRSSRVRDGKWESMIFRDPASTVPLTASVRIDLVDQKSVPKPVEAPTGGNEASDGLSGAALRFDEAVGDQLVKADGEERMSYWLRAYFGQDAKELKKAANSSGQGAATNPASSEKVVVTLEDVTATIRQAYRELRPRSEGRGGGAEGSNVSTPDVPSEPEVTEAMIEGVIGRLKDLEKGDGSATGFDWQRLLNDGELGFDSRWLDLVSGYDPEIPRLLSTGGETAKEGVRRLLEGADRLMKDASGYLEGPLARVLENFEKAANVQTASVTEYTDQYGRWLTHVARADLTVNAIHLKRSLPDPDLHANDVLSRVINQSVTEEELVAAHGEAAAARDAARDWLARHAKSGGVSAETKTQEGSQFSQEDLELWIEANRRGIFGSLISGGVEGAKKVVVDNRSRKGWTLPYVTRLDQLQKMRAWMENRSWSAQAGEPTWSNRRFQALQRLIAAIESRRDVIRKDAMEFLSITDRLGPALSELLELMTPASWAYQPLDVRVDWNRESAADQGKAKPSLDVTSRGMELQDVLNTAELNTVALAMHLLCAPLARNPYRVTFLDDPLQNMDELTVTTVARAMAKLLRLMSQAGFQGWDIVMLLHGADDCERMVQEAPAVFYRLPWSSPEQSKTESEPDKIEAESGRSEQEGKLFDFIGFLGLRGV